MSDIDNARRVKRKAIQERWDERQHMEDIAVVMARPEGRRVMNDLLRRCGVGRLSFAGPGQAEQTAFYEGQRNIGNYYWGLLTKNFKKEWLLMTEEAERKTEASNGDRNHNGEPGRNPGNDDTHDERA